MILARIVFAPIYLTALVLDKVVSFLAPRANQIIAGSAEACELTRHSNDDHFALWTSEFWNDMNSKETS
jgi:hypothetical protein